jgi:hypothetical protein
MATWKPFVELKTSTGRPISRGDLTLIPQAQALTVHFPFGGFVWNRPVAVLVERDGRRERFPIFDGTRAALLAMSGASVFLAMIMVLVRILRRGTAGD